MFSVCVVQKLPFTWFERNPQSMIQEILADLLMKFLLFRKALKGFRPYYHLCLIKLFILYESLHTGICFRFNVGLHSEETFHIAFTPWWTLPFHYVRQVLLLIFFHILKWFGIRTYFKLVMQLLNFKNHFWSCAIPISCSQKLHTHTHTHLYVPIIEVGNKFYLLTSWRYMFCYFRCVSFIEEWWWREVSFSIH